MGIVELIVGLVGGGVKLDMNDLVDTFSGHKRRVANQQFAVELTGTLAGGAGTLVTAGAEMWSEREQTARVRIEAETERLRCAEQGRALRRAVRERGRVERTALRSVERTNRQVLEVMREETAQRSQLMAAAVQTGDLRMLEAVQRDAVYVERQRGLLERLQAPPLPEAMPLPVFGGSRRFELDED